MKTPIEDLNRQVGEEYGKVLPVRIVSGGAPHFDWRSVNIPEDMLREIQSDALLKDVLRHEYGHLFINPRSPAVAETMVYLAMSMGFADAQDVMNVVSDMLVDSTLIAVHGREYLELIEHYLRDTTVPILRFMGSFYAVHARKLGLDTELSETPLGRRMHRILLNGNVPFYSRVYAAYQIIMSSFSKIVRVPYSSNAIVVEDVNPARARKELGKQGFDLGRLESEDIGHLRLPGMGSLFRTTANPRRISEVISRISVHMDEHVPGRFKGLDFDIWSIGDDEGSLDMVKTVENSGVAIPGLTTFSRVEREGSGDSGPGTAVILLDCSGSMKGEKFLAAQVAVLNIVRRFENTGVLLGFVPFSGGINERHVVYPTRSYDEIVDLLLRILPDGGTMVGPALRAARAMEPDLIYLITDTHIADSQELREMSEVRKVIFVVSTKGDEGEEWVREMDHVYVVSPEDLMVKTKEVGE